MTYASTLLFLGAGASAPFGVPTMKQMVERLSMPDSNLGTAERNFLSQLTPKLAEYFGEYYDLEKLLDVVEDLATATSTRASFNKAAPHALFRYRGLLDRTGLVQAENAERDFDQSVLGDARVAENLRNQITDQIANWCGRADFEMAFRTYRELFDQVDMGQFGAPFGAPRSLSHLPSEGDGSVCPMTLVTTNYDDCLERALSRLGVAPAMGFYYDAISRSLEFQTRPDPRRFANSPLESSIGGQNGEELLLLKLHGSANWWRTDDNRVVEIGNGAAGQRLPDGAGLLRREIRYPVSTKELVGLPYSQLYSWFGSALAHSRIWVFIGYSFGDTSVLRLMEELWTPRKNIVIIGHHASAIARRAFPGPISAGITPVNADFRDPAAGAHAWGREIQEAVDASKAVRI